MFTRIVSQLALVTMIACCASPAGAARKVTTPVLSGGGAKAENGLIISWRAKVEDAKAVQIDVSDARGSLLAGLRLLSIVPDAKTAWVADVSARPGGIIAVGALYESKEGPPSRVRPAEALLIFDLSGRLQSFFSLDPSREIERLEVDEHSNVWVLNSGVVDGRDPAQSPMVTEYSVKGEIVRDLLLRSLFPPHEMAIDGTSRTGFAHMGYDSYGVWFWLPGSADLVMIPKAGGNPTITRTGLPGGEGVGVLTDITREDSGDFAAEFVTSTQKTLYFRWSPAKPWERFTPGVCDGMRLFGVDQHMQIYTELLPGGAARVCTFRSP